MNKNNNNNQNNNPKMSNLRVLSQQELATVSGGVFPLAGFVFAAGFVAIRGCSPEEEKPNKL